MAVSITRATLSVKKCRKLLSGLLAFGMVFGSVFVGTASVVFARSVQYAPGETLNPDCSPGESNCNVAQLSVNTTLNTFGIGTTSPYAKLSVVGEVVSTYFSATSTTATSTFAGGLLVGGGALTYDFSSGITSIDDLQTGPMTFDTNAGILSWIDLPVTSTATAGTVESYSARIDGNSILTVYGESNGSGSVQNLAVGIGTSSPFAKLSVMGNAFFAGTMTASIINATSTTATSTFANGISITGGCIEIDGGCLAVGGGAGSPGGSSTQVQFNNGGGSFGGSSSFVWNNTTKRLGIGTTTPYAPLSVYGEVVASYFSATSTTATSTFANGISITGGCLSVGGTCIGDSSSVIESGTQGQISFYNAAGTTLTSTSTLLISQDEKVGVGTASPNSTLHIAGSVATAVAVKTANYTVTEDDSVILADTSGSVAFTVTLPSAVGIAGRTYTIKDYGGNANIESITVDADGMQNIDGALTKVINTSHQSLTIVSNGSNWNTVSFAVGSINGLLQSSGGVVSATSTVSIVYGGTGLSTAPTYGQLLLGDNTGAYALTATSSLGLLDATVVSTLITNYMTKWTGSAFANSQLFDNGTNVGINTATPSQTLEVAGIVLVQNYVNASYFTATSTEVASTFPYASSTAITADNLFATNFILSNFNGPIQANAGLLSATTSVGVLYGGTGLMEIPDYGEVLMGNHASGYTLTATSSLGLGTVLAGTTGQFPFYGANDSILTATSSLFLSDASFVGIGTITPTTELQVVGTITTTFASTTVISSSESAYFATGGGAHSVGIGTTSPWRTLSVDGTVAFANLTTPDVSGSFALCLDPATSEVYSSGGNTCTVSSARFKHNIESITVSGVSLVNQLRPVTFDLNGNNESHYGFIAEEVALVDRKMIFTDKGTTSPRGVRYEELTAVLAKAIQEQQVQIERLNTQSQTGLIAGTGSLVLDGLRSFGVMISETVTRFRDIFVETIHIEDRLCVDDVCLGKEELKTLLRNAGGVTVSAPSNASVAESSSSTLDSLGGVSVSGEVATSTESITSSVDDSVGVATSTESVSEAGVSESLPEAVSGSEGVVSEPASADPQTPIDTTAEETPASPAESSPNPETQSE